MRRTTSMAIGESGISFFPEALRRAFSSISAMAKNGRRPRAFLLTGGNVADIKGAAPLLASIGPSKHTIADRGYDADHLRSFLDERGTEPVIPDQSHRKRRFPFDAKLCRLRNVIERTFCRL